LETLNASSLMKKNLSYICFSLAQQSDSSRVVLPHLLELLIVLVPSPNSSGGSLNMFLLAETFRLQELQPFAGLSKNFVTKPALRARS
jgi:hypothetical protein